MRRIALAVLVGTLAATPVARANDIPPAGAPAQERIAADGPKDVPAASPGKDDVVVTSASPVKDAGTTETTPAPFVHVEEPRTGQFAGATVLRSLHVGLALSQAYDVYSTTHALKRGAIEVNPLLKDTVTSRMAFIGLKVAMTAGPIYEAEKLWRKKHRVAAIALMAAANGIMLAVAARNAHVMDNAVTVR